MKLLLVIFLLASINVQAQQTIKWPDHHKALIILTYDDGLPSQLTTAVPQLERAHLTATFFLTGNLEIKAIPAWRELDKKGMELANHTVFHPCAANADNMINSNNYTQDAMIGEIQVMNNFLFALDGKTNRTYAYPCTDTTAGGKSYIDTLQNLHIIKYARLGGDSDEVVTNFKTLDPMRVPSYGLEGNNSGAELIAYVKSVEKAGGMGIIMFHGIGGEYITTSVDAHQELITYLRKHKKSIWVTTFQNGMDYVMGQRQVQ